MSESLLNPTPDPTLNRAPRRRGAAFWIPWVVVAALVVVAISLAIEISGLSDQLRDESGMVTNLAAKASRAQQVLEVLTSPSAEQVTLTAGKAAVEPTGGAIYLPDRGGLIFHANNLKPLPADKRYELWVMPASGQAAVPAGLFSPDGRGRASLVLPRLPTGVRARAFGVTMEGSGGSETPTEPILLSGAVPGV